MKKLLFFILLSTFAFGQNASRDTLMVNGTQLASILKIGNSKIYIAQNKELPTPYILQKDGSFISKGAPFVTVNTVKTIGAPEKFAQNMFDAIKLSGTETKEVVKNDEKDVFIKTTNDTKEKRIILISYFPLSDKILNINLSINYKDNDDRIEKYYQLRDIIQKGVLILEDYYKYRKD